MRNRRQHIRIATMLASLVFCVLTAFASCDWMFSEDEVYPQAITMTYESARVLIGDNQVKLNVVFRPSNTTNTSVVWKSDAPDILDVGIDTGILKPRKTGKATITVTSVVDNTISDSALFVVSDVVDSSFDYVDIKEDERTACISGFGRNVSTQALKKIEIPSEVSITSDGKSDIYQIVSIASGAFREMSFLETVVLPNTIRTIGASAFSNCGNLRSVTLPEGLETIGAKCFEGCSSLYSITIPKSVTQIEAEAFSGCFRLVEVYDLSDALTIERGSDANGMVAKHALAVHADASDASCLRMDEADEIAYFIKSDDDWMAVGPLSVQASQLDTISGACKTINDYAFYGMPKLVTVNFASRDGFPKSIIEIGKGAFAECKKLENVYFSNEAFAGTLKIIGEEAFKGCASLREFDVTSAISEIRDRAFEECAKLTTFRVDDSIGAGIDYGTNIFTGCVNLNSMSLPTLGDKTIGQIFSAEPFGGTKDCYEVVQGENGEKYYISSKLRSVNLTNAASVPDRAFLGCKKIVGCELSEGIKRIGDKAFSDVGITRISIPNSVVEFGQDVFSAGMIVEYEVGTSAEEYDYFGFLNGALKIKNMDGLKWYEKGINQLVSSVSFEPQGGGTFSSIPANCFKGCFQLALVTIPEGVESIGDNAFSGCSALSSVSLPDSLETIGDEAFAFCSSLPSITIKPSVTSIGSAAFGGCTKLGSITLPFTGKSTDASASEAQRCFGYVFGSDEKFDVRNSAGQKLTTLANQAIGTEGGKQFYIPNTLETVTVTADAAADGTFANMMFSGCNMIKRLTLTINNLKKLPAGAFKGCGNLETLDAVFKNSTTNDVCLEEVGDSAFEGCAKLPSYVFANSLTSIGDRAFSGCSMFSSIGLPDSLTSIGSEAFAFCSALTSVIVPQAVTSIGSGAFGGCTGLTEIVLPFTGESTDASMSGAQQCFGHIFGSDEKFNVMSSSAQPLTTLVNQAISDETDKMFYIPKSLKKASVKAQAANDGTFLNMMFAGCVNLTDLNLDIGNLRTIPECAFAGCSNLLKVVIKAKDGSDSEPLDTLRVISKKAFSGCTRMQDIDVSSTIETIGESAFEGCINLLLDNDGFLAGSPIKELGKRAFCGCKNLRMVDLWMGWRDSALTDYVTILPEKVFYDCLLLKIVLPPDNTSMLIADDAFGVSNDVEANSIQTKIFLPNGYSISNDTDPKPNWFTSNGHLRLYDYYSLFFLYNSGDGNPDNRKWKYETEKALRFSTNP